MIDAAVAELTPVVGVKDACAAVGWPRATHYRWHRRSGRSIDPQNAAVETQSEREWTNPLRVRLKVRDPSGIWTGVSVMTNSQETGEVTGTKDKDYNIIWFTEACLSNALRLEQYCKDAEQAGDDELVQFFRRAQEESRKGAEQGKQLMAARLGRS